jgi:hypothetical protein
MLGEIITYVQDECLKRTPRLRHDNDRKLPRTMDEIFDLNSAVASKMEDLFLKKGVPVVPSIGEMSG